MLKLLIPLFLILIFSGVGFFYFQNSQKKPVYQSTPLPKIEHSPNLTTQNPTPTPSTKSDPCDVLVNGSEDIPPVYKEGISWQEPIITERKIDEFENPSTGEGFKSKLATGCLIKTTTTLDFANKLRNFYIDNLSKKDWKLVDAADGSGSFLITYNKGQNYLLLNKLNGQIELFYTQ